MKLAVQAVVLCALGAALGLLASPFTPHPARLSVPVLATAEQPGGACELPGGHQPEVPRISVDEARPLCVACAALFVDARSAQEYAAGHITGALHLAPGENPAEVLGRVAAARFAVVYDGEPGCALADQVAKSLLARGAKDVRVLTGAWPAWMAAGGPGASGPCSQCAVGGAR